MSLITGYHIQNRTFVSSITFNKFKKVYNSKIYMFMSYLLSNSMDEIPSTMTEPFAPTLIIPISRRSKK